jgi:hypothetical protein
MRNAHICPAVACVYLVAREVDEAIPGVTFATDGTQAGDSPGRAGKERC